MVIRGENDMMISSERNILEKNRTALRTSMETGEDFELILKDFEHGVIAQGNGEKK